MASSSRKTSQTSRTTSKTTPRTTTKGQPAALDLGDIRSLAKMVNQYDLSELELDTGKTRLRLRRERHGAQVTTVATQPVVQPQVVSAPAPALPNPTEGQAAATETDDGSVLVTSPFVGTFYRGPSPEAPSFVERDDNVKKGQVLCIVEAMKLMNEIEAETDCKILEIIAKNAEPVEFGQALYRVFPIA